MNRDEENKKPTLATTSAKPNGTEADYLAQQAEEAKAAITATLKRVLSSSGKVADPRVWAKSHPIATIAVTAAAGFTAAVMAVPSKEEQELRRLAEFERLTHRKTESNGHNTPPPENPLKSWLMPLVTELIAIAKPALLGAISSYFRTPTEPEETGHSDEKRGD